jgi:hypothetical protein
MARIVQFQTNFSVGELDPLLRARTDLQQYQNALESAENVTIQPQGGAKRRAGLEFIYNFGSSFTSFKLIPFEYSVNDSYLLVVVTGRIYVFKNGVLQTNINGSGNDYITASAITAGIIDQLNYIQAVDTLILVHEDLEPQRLLRNSDTDWTVGVLPLTFIPKHAYVLDTHEPTFTITPSGIEGNITITASSVTTDNGTAQAGGIDTITLKSATSFTSDDQPNGMFIEITAGTGSGQTRHVEDYVASTKVLTVYPDWNTAPDATSQYEIKAFKPAAVDEYLNVVNGFGRARYVEYVSDTQMKAYVEVPFFDTGAIAAGDWESEHGYEDVWSAVRGWPRSAAFHEGRLYFGGSSSRPNTVWGSKVIDYFNFDVGTGLDDESVEATINTNQLNVITTLNPGPDLQIFTTAGEFVVSQLGNEPVTPTNFLVKPQSRIGSRPGVPIEDLKGSTIFVQRQGKSLMSFQFSDTTSSYSASNLSVFSSHLLKGPVDMSIRRATSTDETDRLFLVNGDDGSMTVYSVLQEQNVVAPSKFTTDGDFIAIANEIAETYTIVKRTVLPYATCTITVSDAANIVDNETIVLTDNAGVSTTFTAVTGTPSTNFQFQVGGVLTNDQVADNLATAINSVSAFDAPNPAAAVVTVTRTVSGDNNLTVTSSDNVRLTKTDFTAPDDTNYYLEKFDEDLTLDSAVIGGAVSSVNMDHLAGKSVEVIRDGIVEPSQVVPISPFTVAFGTAASSSCQVGLNYNVTMVTMPAEPKLPQGTIQGVKKRIVQVDAVVANTQNLSINSKLVPFRNFGVSVLGNPVAEFTGTKTVHGLLGFSGTGQITITQTEPLKMTLLGLEYKMSVGN